MTEKQIRQRITREFDPATLRSFYEVRPAHAIWTFAHIWMGIVGALLIAGSIWRADLLWPKLILVPLTLYIGTRHNAFAVQIHEASHNLLLPWRKWNDVFCNVLGGYWTLNDVQAYRAVHLVHHTDLHLSTDPDLELYVRFRMAQRTLRNRKTDFAGSFCGSTMRSGGCWRM